jgi:hypothetical protein
MGPAHRVTRHSFGPQGAPRKRNVVQARFRIAVQQTRGVRTVSRERDVLLREAHRVLCDGGVFIHFGTLGYHHGDLSEMLSVGDVRHAFELAGFEIEAERWVSTRDIGTRPDRLVTVLLRNWLVVARKR